MRNLVPLILYFASLLPARAERRRTFCANASVFQEVVIGGGGWQDVMLECHEKQFQ